MDGLARQAAVSRTACPRHGLNIEGSVAAVNVVLYTREGCHLCDVAAGMLARYGIVPRAVDIDSDPELVSRYNHCVPVIVIDGKERFRGRINEVLLRRIVGQARSNPST